MRAPFLLALPMPSTVGDIGVGAFRRVDDRRFPTCCPRTADRFRPCDGMRPHDMHKSAYLSAQLRESAPYLRDAGWHQTADLIIAAADEIDALRVQLGAANDAGNETKAPPLQERRARPR
jgi:hypothetical protein